MGGIHYAAHLRRPPAADPVDLRFSTQPTVSGRRRDVSRIRQAYPASPRLPKGSIAEAVTIDMKFKSFERLDEPLKNPPHNTSAETDIRSALIFRGSSYEAYLLRPGFLFKVDRAFTH